MPVKMMTAVMTLTAVMMMITVRVISWQRRVGALCSEGEIATRSNMTVMKERLTLSVDAETDHQSPEAGLEHGMASPPNSPVHLHVRKLSVTNEEGTSSQSSHRKPGKKIAALVGEDEMSGPPPVTTNPKSRFRNGHASFRLRMLQEQHGGTGFEPEEVRNAIGKMKLGQAVGPVAVPVEARKVLGNCGVNWLTQFFNSHDKIHDEGLRTTDRLEAEGDGHRLPGEMGLLIEGSTADAIFITYQVIEKYREERKPCYLAFLNLEKAYDRLPHKGHVRRLESGFTNSTRDDKEDGYYSGVHQGSALSPFLSVLTLDCTVNHLDENPHRTMLFADDIALVADSREELEEKVQLWQGALADNGLRLNVKKTKFISSRSETARGR
ncbi:unnamed protein product [Heligmosomoides polygyrus]|uniref:Reverse transcriptase domain-containing protein n=1 Tax=Heligmosomoides polygyrus TaxID=6339 RepID=A0A3P8B7U1_HELPZ|nr:unnamed protein product [Heligmosomoides polygyrus]